MICIGFGAYGLALRLADKLNLRSRLEQQAE
jgi:hypothetical protein